VNPIKMLGLVALAALLAMAFVGASSAMAQGTTALCKRDESPCTPTKVEEEKKLSPIIKHVHETTLTGHKGVLLSSIEVECDVLFLGDAASGGLSEELENAKEEIEYDPLIISGSFTYTNCEGGCTASEENSPSEIRVLKEASELAKVNSGTGAGAGLVHLVCGGFINCRYVGSGLVGHGLGPLTSSETNGSVTLSGQEVAKESGTFCPSTGKLDITTTPLEPTYISS
jgi:hypothetical protein